MAQENLKQSVQLLVVGGSAGSLRVLMRFLPFLSASLKLSIVIVLHRKNTGDTLLTDILSVRSPWPVKEVEEKEKIVPGYIYVAPADYHVLIEKDHTFSLDVSEKVNFSRPSIDVTFESAAYAFGGSLICMLLSGANADGADGMKVAAAQNGITIIQDPETAEMPVMPRSATVGLQIDHILKPTEMADFINKFL